MGRVATTATTEEMGDKNTLYKIHSDTFVYDVKDFFELRRLPPCCAGVWGQDPAAKTAKLAAEIANGRLAMMAIIGMFFPSGVGSL
jgi:hypothetical protein